MKSEVPEPCVGGTVQNGRVAHVIVAIEIPPADDETLRSLWAPFGHSLPVTGPMLWGPYEGRARPRPRPPTGGAVRGFGAPIQSNELSSPMRVIIPPHFGHWINRHSASTVTTVWQVGQIACVLGSVTSCLPASLRPGGAEAGRSSPPLRVEVR
jgi:hypothetical protein